MDIILDILIRKSDLNKININEILVDWGGEKFSQVPKKYKYKSSIEFHEHETLSYYNDIVENNLNISEYIALTLEGESLYKLECVINDDMRIRENEYIDYRKFRNDADELISFIDDLYKKLDSFAIISLLNEEDIYDRYIIRNKNDAIDILKKSLSWNDPRGIVIIKN